MALSCNIDRIERNIESIESKFAKIFKRPKNREDGSDFDDFWTESIVSTQSIFSKIFERTKNYRIDRIDRLDRSIDRSYRSMAALLVDARHEWAFSNGHIPGAVNLPFSFSTTKAHQTFAKTYPKDRRLVLYCGDPACDRSKYLAIKLRDDFGFSRLFIYADGYQDYLKHAE